MRFAALVIGGLLAVSTTVEALLGGRVQIPAFLLALVFIACGMSTPVRRNNGLPGKAVLLVIGLAALLMGVIFWLFFRP